MSKTKAGGSTSNVRDSAGKRLGVKLFGGQPVKAGSIIVRQRGMSKIAGDGTRVGRDFTIYATRDGVVTFTRTKARRFSGNKVPRTKVSVQ